MERNNAAERAAWLRAQIAENSDLYYNSDAPKISDFEYDAMFEELRSIEAAFPELDSPDSPTHRVGGKGHAPRSPRKPHGRIRPRIA